MPCFSAKSSKHNIQTTTYDTSFIVTKSDVDGSYDHDPKGSFRIGIDYDRELLLCEHKDSQGAILKLAGESASNLMMEVVKRGLISLIEHAAYLGREISKAEIALKIGHDYQQDEPWEIDSATDPR